MFIGDVIALDESTYINTRTKSRFIDKDYGEWWATPNNVIHSKQGHKSRSLEKTKKTWLKKYGIDNPLKLEKNRPKDKKLSIDTIKQRIFDIHGYVVVIDENTYISTNEIAWFVDMEYGRWKTKVNNVIFGKKGHKSRSLEKARQTCLERFGVENPNQNEEIKEKSKKTCLERFGVEYSLQDQETKEKSKKTCLERFGVENPMQNKDISLKSAKSNNNSSILYHWKTGEEIICVASYEKATVEQFNKIKEDFIWQIPFTMPDGRVYICDCYLPKKDLYVEIKRLF